MPCEPSEGEQVPGRPGTGVCLTNADPGLPSNLPLMDTFSFPHRGGHALSICTLESWRQGAPWVPLTTRAQREAWSAAACTSSAPSA